ncbi:MAG: DNA-3-methyladenine glycosylase I, partial [Simkania sp.]|nr:DNA-3-methyladenine glycosylase I [Simkania sp.]
AQAFLKIQKEHQSFDAFVWPFVEGKPQVNRWNAPEDVPCVSPESAALSKALKKWGFSFVGPTIVYSYMQAAGLVSDHLKRCFL